MEIQSYQIRILWCSIVDRALHNFQKPFPLEPSLLFPHTFAPDASTSTSFSKDVRTDPGGCFYSFRHITAYAN